MISLGTVLKQGMVIQLINTFILFIGLRFLLFKPVTEFMEKRRKNILEDIKKARDKERSAENLEKKYKTKLDEIREKEEEILTKAREEAIVKKEDIISKAKIEAEKIKERASDEIKKYQINAKDQMKREMIDVAGLMTEKVIKLELDENKHQEIIDDSIEELSEFEWIN